MNTIITSRIFYFFLFIATILPPTTAQNILQLKLQSINADGSFGTEDIIYEIVDDSKLYIVQDGVRTENFFELKLQPFEIISGAEGTGYDVLIEGKHLFKLGILDMRHMNTEERKAAFKVDIPILVVAIKEGDNPSTDFMTAEIIKGKITKNKVDVTTNKNSAEKQEVIFQLLKDERFTMKMKEDKFYCFDGDSEFAVYNLKSVSQEKNGKATLYYYETEAAEYDFIIIGDLSLLTIPERKELFETEAQAVIGLRKKGTDEILTSEVKIIKGKLSPVETKKEKTKTAEDIRNEFASLFQRLENGFKADMKNPTRNDEFTRNDYKIQLAPGNMSPRDGRITAFDNGVIFYSNLMRSKDEIINILGSYPASKGYKVESLAKTNDRYSYVVKKNSGEAIGFLKFHKSSDIWSFNASLPLEHLEKDITRLFKHAENHFEDLDKVLVEENKDTKQYTTKSPINYTIDPFLSKVKGVNSSFLALSYRLCDVEAIKYQIEKMNLTFSGYKKTTNQVKNNGVEYVFEDAKGETIVIEISQATNTHYNTNVFINHKLNLVKEIIAAIPPKAAKSTYRTGRRIAHDAFENKEDVIHPDAPPYLPFAGKYGGDDLISLMGRHYKDPAIQNWIKQANLKVGFTKFETADGGLVIVDNDAEGIDLRFRENKLMAIEIYIPKFKKKLPFGVTDVASLKNNQFVEFRYFDHDYRFDISENSYLQFEEYKGKVHRLQIW